MPAPGARTSLTRAGSAAIEQMPSARNKMISVPREKFRPDVFMPCLRLRRRERFEINFPRLPLAAFALQRDRAGSQAAIFGFVHQLAVDVVLDRVAAADDLIGVPFAGVFFVL